MTVVRQKRPQEESTSRRPGWAGPSLIALPVVIGLVAVAARPITDPRTWTAVRDGVLSLRTGDVNPIDPLIPSGPIGAVSSQWLADLATATAFDALGPAAVIALRGLCLILVFGLFLREARSTADTIPAVIASFLGLFGCLRLGQPAEVVAVLLVMVTVVTWRRTSQTLRTPWVLVPLTWVWACVHSSWVLGLVIGLVTVAGLVLDGRLGRRDITRLTAVIAASALAATLTPAGPGLLVRSLRPDIAGGTTLAGWSFADTTDPVSIVMAVTCLVVLGSWLRTDRSRPWWLVAHAGLALAFAVSFSATAPYAACLLVPIVADALQAQRGRPGSAVQRPAKLTFVVALTLAVAAACGLAVPLSDVRGTAPLSFVPDLARLPGGTTILNDPDSGGWLLVHDPGLRIVIDSRVARYNHAYVTRYVSALRAEPGWAEFVDASGATVALLPVESPLLAALEERRGWRVVRSTGGHVLLAID